MRLAVLFSVALLGLLAGKEKGQVRWEGACPWIANWPFLCYKPKRLGMIVLIKNRPPCCHLSR